VWIDADEDDVEPRRVPRRELTEATRSLAALLAAGLPLTKALETTRDVVGGGISPVLDDVIVEVKGGAGLAKALAAHPDIFSPLYVGVIRAGERSGRLASITDRLAEELERQDDLRSRIVSASIYPTALMMVGVVSVMVLLLLVIPRFGALLAETGAELPAATRALIAVSEGVRSYWPYLVGALVVAFTSTAAFLSSPAGVQAVS
jgi:general secretion pathway protein F